MQHVPAQLNATVCEKTREGFSPSSALRVATNSAPVKGRG